MMELPEPDANVKLTINHSFFYNRGNTEGFLRILDDDRLPVVSIKADNGEIAENAGLPTFKVFATGIFENTTLSIVANTYRRWWRLFYLTTCQDMSLLAVNFSDSDGDYTYTGLFTLPSRSI